MTGFNRALLGLSSLAILCCIVLSSGAQSPGLKTAPDRDEAPKLVVAITVDGLSQAQLLQSRDRFGEGGFGRLFKDGAWFTQARYGYSTTVTATGHATLLTGASPSRHGLVGNDWIDPRTGKMVYCTEDPSAKYLGEQTKDHAGTSPKNLLVTTIGDELRMANGGRSRIFAASMKDRGSILPAGKLGIAYFYSGSTGRFITSDYYLKDYPDWWKRFHAESPQNKWYGRLWTPLHDEAAWGVADDRSHVANVKGLGRSFPHKVDGGKPEAGPEYYDSLPGTPFGHEYLVEFSKALIRDERLGKNPENVTDLYAVSFSSHDYINHTFGPESREAADDTLRLDQVLADFFKFLDEWVGLDRTLIVITADHGFSRAPEYWKDVARIDAGRINHDEMMKKLNGHLSQKYGEGLWAIGWQLPTAYLDHELIDQKKLSYEEVEREAARFLSAWPGVHTVFTRTQLQAGAVPPTRLGKQVLKSWHPLVSGDLLVIQKDGWYLYDKEKKYAAMHGAAWNYDTQVPLMFLGRRWFESGRFGQDAEPGDIAPTLSHLLNIGLPSGSDGRVLVEILRK